MKQGAYRFGNKLCAQANVRLGNATIQSIWRGFCSDSGELCIEAVDACTFATKNMQIPELAGDQEYRILVTEQGIAINARDDESLTRAAAVLMMRIRTLRTDPGDELFEIETCDLKSRYSVTVRMIHFCVFPETTPQFIRKCIRLAGVMQYTHVVLEFWGMLQYDCLKELAWPNAFSKAEARAIVQEIRDLGMEPIPMINHLGHASACRVSGGKHVVLDQNPKLAPLFSDDGWSWNITSSHARQLLCQIRRELYELFGDCDYIHLGCDEVYSYESGEKNQRLMRNYLHDLIEEVKAEGKKPIIWGDMLLNEEACGVSKPYFCGCDTPENAEKMIEAIPKDTILADWHYNVTEVPIRTSLYLKEHGFQVLGAPWLDPNNCKAHVETIEENQLMGLMVTTWHTLAQQMPHVVTSALLCGAYHSPWCAIARNQIAAETGALLRKVLFVRGDYKEAGWTDSQIFLQAQPMV